VGTSLADGGGRPATGLEVEKGRQQGEDYSSKKKAKPIIKRGADLQRKGMSAAKGGHRKRDDRLPEKRWFDHWRPLLRAKKEQAACATDGGNKRKGSATERKNYWSGKKLLMMSKKGTFRGRGEEKGRI